MYRSENDGVICSNAIRVLASVTSQKQVKVARSYASLAEYRIRGSSFKISDGDPEPMKHYLRTLIHKADQEMVARLDRRSSLLIYA